MTGSAARSASVDDKPRIAVDLTAVNRKLAQHRQAVEAAQAVVAPKLMAAQRVTTAALTSRTTRRQRCCNLATPLRLLRRPRTRGAGRPACSTRRTTRSAARSGSSGDGPGEPEPAERRHPQNLVGRREADAMSALCSRTDLHALYANAEGVVAR